MHWDYWSRNAACAPQREKPPQGEACVIQGRVALAPPSRESPYSNEEPARSEVN